MFRDDTLAADDRAFFLKVRDVVEAAVSQTTFRQIAMKLQNTRDIRLTGDPVKTVEVLANRYTLNYPSALVFCGISSSKAICRGTGWSTPSRTTRRTSRTMTGPPSSRPWGASSSSWLQRSGRAWPTRPESLGAPSTTVSPGFLHSIDVLPLARRNLTVARAFFWMSAVLTREDPPAGSTERLRLMF